MSNPKSAPPSARSARPSRPSSNAAKDKDKNEGHNITSVSSKRGTSRTYILRRLKAAAMVPAPVERSELPGHRQRSQIPQHCQWWRSPSLAQRCGAAARKDQRNLAASTILAVVTRAREAAPIPARSEADRPAPAGSAALRLLADVAISFSRNCCWQLQRRTLALGRSAPLLTSASPGRGGGDGAGAGRAQRATGSSPTIANSAALSVVQRLPLSLPPRARARRRRFQ